MGSEMCIRDSGSLDGLKTDDHLLVYRDNLKVSYLQIKSVEKRKSIGKIVSAYQHQPGDVVFRDTTIEAVNVLVLGKVHNVDVLKLAKLHADADSKLGFDRLLTYGKPTSESRLRIDGESGLPMTVAGGCIVSKSMQAFVEEYNRLMSEAAAKNK